MLASALPLLLGFVLAKPYPVADPPYHPARLQYLKSIPAGHGFQELKRDDLMMSDLPWAVAVRWAGQWLADTNVQPDFYSLNDDFRPIRLYLTEMTTDQRYVSRVFAKDNALIGSDLLNMQINGELPDGFPSFGVDDEFFLNNGCYSLSRNRTVTLSRRGGYDG